MTSINEEVTWDGPKHGPLPIHRLDVRFREPCAYLCTVTSEDRALILDMYTTIPKKGERWFPMVLIHWGGWVNGLVQLSNQHRRKQYRHGCYGPRLR